MRISPVIPIILLLLGAVGIAGLSLSTRLRRHSGWLILAVTGLAFTLLFVSRWARPVVTILSLWRPALLLDTILSLHADAISHPVALSTVLLMACAACVELTSPQRSRPRLAAAMLTLLATELAVLWSANVVTMLVALVLYDLTYALAYLLADGSARVAMRGLFLGMLATLCLLTGALLSGGLAVNGLWRTVTLGNNTSLSLLMLASILRLSVYPFHLSAPDDFLSPSPLTIPLLLRPLPGWLLWLRIIMINQGSMPAQPWAMNLALASAVLGVLLAWSGSSHLPALLWSGVGTAGAVLLAGITAGKEALAIVAAGSVAWTLGLGVLFLGRFVTAQGLRWKIPALIGGWALLGLPGTLGFASGAMLYGGVAGAGNAPSGLAVGSLIWTTFLIPALIRCLLTAPRVPREQPPGDSGGGFRIRGLEIKWLSVMELGYTIGSGLPALLLIVAGLFPALLFDGAAVALPSFVTMFRLPGVTGWLLWLLGLAAGGLLSWKDDLLRSRGGAALDTIYSLLRLEWLYDALGGAVNRGLSVLRTADELIGGAGALLWACLIFLLYILAKGGR